VNNKSKIDNLKKRINNLDKNENIKNSRLKNKKGVSFGFRIGVELVSAIAVGTIIGIFVDKYLGSKPFGLIIFFILGSMAGFLNIYRVMRRIEENVSK
tara:strand:- start:835 stop:1128 length:294 start_codon:yes stop_codon:yes gene_type:complete